MSFICLQPKKIQVQHNPGNLTAWFYLGSFPTKADVLHYIQHMSPSKDPYFYGSTDYETLQGATEDHLSLSGNDGYWKLVV